MSEKPKPQSFGWPFWLVLAVIISALAGLANPKVIRGAKKASQTEATSHLRQIGLALFEFETEYGSFPSEATVAKVTAEYPDHGLDLSGKSSNSLFRQLFAANITQSEQMFYADINGTKKPNGNFSPGNALESREVGYGYVAGLSTVGNPARAVAFCPIIPGTDRFDPKPFDGKAVILRIDNSVASLNIDEDGHAVSGGHTLFSPENPIWGGVVPDIRYPEGLSASNPSFFQKLFSK